MAPLSIINAGVAGITAAALLAIATVLASRHMHRQALALSLVASLLAGVTGYHLMGSLFNPSFYGFPAVGIGAGLLLAGGISCLLLTVNRLYALIPVKQHQAGSPAMTPFASSHTQEHHWLYQ